MIITVGDDVVHRGVMLCCDVPYGRESEHRHGQTGHGIDQGHRYRVYQNLVASLVVARERNDGAEGEPDGVEHLSGGINPHLRKVTDSEWKNK